MGRTVVVVPAILCALSASAVADRKVEAQQLFDEGKALMGQGRLDDACAKFAASHELAPSTSTLMNLGACHEAARRLATAWATFKEATALAAREDPALLEPSRRRVDALQPRLSSLRIEVPEGSRVPDLEILRNGVVLVEAQWNSSQYVDGGEYEIVARAPSTVAWTARVSVATALDQRTVEIPRLVAAGEPAAPAAPRRDLGSRSSRFTPMRKSALVAGGLGVVALGAGAWLGVRATGYQSDSDAICPTTTCNDPEGLRLNDQARSTGTKATFALTTGGLLIVGGVALWYFGRPASAGLAPMVSDDTVGLSWSGNL